MRRRPGVDVGEVPTPDFHCEPLLPGLDKAPGLDLLLRGLLGALHDHGVDRGLVAVVLLGVQAPGLFDGDLDRARVVVLKDAQVDVNAPGVELRVDDAEVPELGVALLLAVVEPHDEEPVDLLHFSHSCCSFLLFVRPAIIGPGEDTSRRRPGGRFGSFLGEGFQALDNLLAHAPALLRGPVALDGLGEGDVLGRFGVVGHSLGALLHPLLGGGEFLDYEAIGGALKPRGELPPLEGVDLLLGVVELTPQDLRVGVGRVVLAPHLPELFLEEADPPGEAVGRVLLNVHLGDLIDARERCLEVGLRAQLLDHGLDLLEGLPLLLLRGIGVGGDELRVVNLDLLAEPLDEGFPGCGLCPLDDVGGVDGALGIVILKFVLVHLLLLLPVVGVSRPKPGRP